MHLQATATLTTVKKQTQQNQTTNIPAKQPTNQTTQHLNKQTNEQNTEKRGKNCFRKQVNLWISGKLQRLFVISLLELSTCRVHRASIVWCGCIPYTNFWSSFVVKIVHKLLKLLWYKLCKKS